MRTAAEFADEWNYIGPLRGAAERMARIDALCAEYGRDPSSLRRSTVLNLHLTSDRAEAERVTTGVASRMRAIGGASQERPGRSPR